MRFVARSRFFLKCLGIASGGVSNFGESFKRSRATGTISATGTLFNRKLDVCTVLKGQPESYEQHSTVHESGRNELFARRCATFRARWQA